MSFEKIKLTNKGRQLLAKAAAGQVLTFSRIKMGDGQIAAQVIETMSDVINEKVSLRLNDPTTGAGYTTISGNFRNAAAEDVFTGDGQTKAFKLSATPSILTDVKINGTSSTSYTYDSGNIIFTLAPASGDEIKVTYNLDGFYWREIGVFAQDPDEGEILFAYQNAYALAEYIASASSEIVEKVVGASFIFSSEIDVNVSVNESLVLMPLSQGQYKTHLLQAGTEIEDADQIPLYDADEGKEVKVTVAQIKEYVKNVPIMTELTMTTAGWSDGQYSFESQYPSEQYDIEVEYAKTCTQEQVSAWNAALLAGSITDNVLTAIGEVPAIDIPIYVTATPLNSQAAPQTRMLNFVDADTGYYAEIDGQDKNIDNIVDSDDELTVNNYSLTIL